MKQMNLGEVQKCEFHILIDFHEFCKTNNLRYYLCGGTLIGAIRHKGFIPWDDDIDIMMPRPDLERFLDLNPQGMLNEHIAIDSLRYDANAISACTRLYDTRTELVFANYRKPRRFGCWIDIFPLDGLSETERGRKKQFRKSRFYQLLAIISQTRLGARRRDKLHTIMQYALVPFLPVIYGVGYKGWNKAIDSLSREYEFHSAEYVGVLEGRAGVKETMLKKDMEPAIDVEFWGRKFTAMANYHEYLTNLYGDYMTPPDGEGKRSRHEIEVYWK